MTTPARQEQRLYHNDSDSINSDVDIVKDEQFRQTYLASFSNTNPDALSRRPSTASPYNYQMSSLQGRYPLVAYRRRFSTIEEEVEVDDEERKEGRVEDDDTDSERSITPAGARAQHEKLSALQKENFNLKLSLHSHRKKESIQENRVEELYRALEDSEESKKEILSMFGALKRDIDTKHRELKKLVRKNSELNSGEQQISTGKKKNSAFDQNRRLSTIEKYEHKLPNARTRAKISDQQSNQHKQEHLESDRELYRLKNQRAAQLSHSAQSKYARIRRKAQIVELPKDPENGDQLVLEDLLHLTTHSSAESILRLPTPTTAGTAVWSEVDLDVKHPLPSHLGETKLAKSKSRFWNILRKLLLIRCLRRKAMTS